jgi:hypothetical protein
MAIVMQMQWDGVTTEQYDAVRERVGWERDAPDGAIFHVSWFGDGALHVVDAWDSADAFQRFVDARLMPVAKGEFDLPGEPTVEVAPAHRVFDALHGDTHS